MVHTRFHNNTTTLSPSLFLSPNAIQTSRPLGILMDSYYSYQNSQQRICWVSISGARGLVTRKCTPRKTGTVLEPCWNLSLLGCKAGPMYIVRYHRNQMQEMCRKQGHRASPKKRKGKRSEYILDQDFKK